MPASTPSPSTPIVRKARGISVIWTLPLLALAICGWLLYQSRQNAGIEITIVLGNGKGLTAGKTQVIANGIPVGLIKELIPDFKGREVRARVLMDKEAEPYLVSDTLFWVVRPELSAAQVQGLETILTGSYIGIRAGSAQTASREFKALDRVPPVSRQAPGLHITLKAEALGSIQIGTGVYFKNIEIGTVQSYQLENGQTVLIDIFIEEEYSKLVRKESRFCNASGVAVDGKLTDLKIRVESLASLLRGGILVQTPTQLQDSPPAIDNQTFPLYKDYDDADYGVQMSLQLASGTDIIEGVTKVMYRGIEAGFVKKITINSDKERSVTAEIHLDPRAEMILRENTQFWIVKPSITPAGISNLQTLIAGAYITFKPGDGNFTDKFKILPDPPAQEPLRPGAAFHLDATGPVPLQRDNPVYYKNIQVGEVIEVELSGDGEKVATTVFIYEPYLDLVTDRSIFWLQSGVEIKADLSGVELKTGPLARMLSGGVSFINPPKAPGKTASPGRHRYSLYGDYAMALAAHPQLQPAGLRFRLQTDDPGSLSAGAPILHKNMIIGKIEGFTFTSDKRQIIIDCFIQEKFRDVVTTGSRFFQISALEVSGGLDGLTMKMAPLQSILQGGIACIGAPANPPLDPGTSLPLYPSLDHAIHADDPELQINFQYIGNLKVGAALQYKGVKVGEVKAIRFTDDLTEIIVQARINKQMEPLFRTTTQVWLVEPEIGLSGVKNLANAISGPQITFSPGAGKPRREFTALASAPSQSINDQPGLNLILETPHLGSLSVGAPLYYRQLQIGEITGFELSPSFKKVLVFVRVEPKYIPVVRSNSRFWNVSGARVSGGIFSGLTFATESLEAVVRGGIAMATPNNEVVGAPADSGQHFPLEEKVEKEWLDWSPDIVLLKQEDLVPGAPLPGLPQGRSEQESGGTIR